MMAVVLVAENLKSQDIPSKSINSTLYSSTLYVYRPEVTSYPPGIYLNLYVRKISVLHSPVRTAVRTGRTAKIWSSTGCAKAVSPVHDFRGLGPDCSPDVHTFDGRKKKRFRVLRLPCRIALHHYGMINCIFWWLMFLHSQRCSNIQSLARQSRSITVNLLPKPPHALTLMARP